MTQHLKHFESMYWGSPCLYNGALPTLYILTSRYLSLLLIVETLLCSSCFISPCFERTKQF